MRRTYLKSKPSLFAPVGLGACLGGALLAGLPVTSAQAQATPEAARLEKMEKENQDLRKRLESLEHLAQKEGVLTSGGAPVYSLSALSKSTISGFVTASYFYDTSRPADNSPNGYLWNRRHNSFAINKFKMTLASPAVERSGEKWDAGYRASLIFGQDAPIVNTGGTAQGFDELREAYVELNAPLGTGLNIKVGQLISLLNFESGDGGSANPNFSQGNQWFFTGNGPSAGIQLGYTFTDWLSANVRVHNGMYGGPVDGNPYKSFMGSLNIKPDSKTSVSLIGFGGRGELGSRDWLKGGSLIASRKLTDKYNLTLATELDYFHLDSPAGSSKWWSIGGWLWADITPKVGLALRGDFIHDPKGTGTTGGPAFLTPPYFAANPGGQDLASLTFTVNYRPVPNIKIQPEIRYDHSSARGAYDGATDRFVIGAGISYLF